MGDCCVCMPYNDPLGNCESVPVYSRTNMFYTLVAIAVLAAGIFFLLGAENIISSETFERIGQVQAQIVGIVFTAIGGLALLRILFKKKPPLPQIHSGRATAVFVPSTRAEFEQQRQQQQQQPFN